jgi:hypothetical protein
MPTPKLQTSRALEIYESDTVPIPNPTIIVSGTGTAPISPFTLADTTTDFFALGVRMGDVVYNTTSKTCSVVEQDISPVAVWEVLLTDDIFPAGGDNYIIYQNSPLSGEPNAGCVLYVGGAGDVEVVTSGGDTVVFTAVPTGSFIPVNVVQLKANGTTAQKIVALW